MTDAIDTHIWSRLLNTPPVPRRHTLEGFHEARNNHAHLLDRLDNPEFTTLEDEQARSAALSFSSAAASLLDILSPPYFQPHPDGLEAVLLAARLYAHLQTSPHPYAQACLNIQIAALMAITQEQDLTGSWFHQRRVASTIMAGYHTDPALHAFYRLAHHTMRDLTGLGRRDIDPPSVIARQVENHLLADARHGAHRMQYPRLFYLVGIHFWAVATHRQRLDSDLEQTSQAFTSAAQSIDEPHLAATIPWIRAAYARINLSNQADKETTP